MNIFHVSDLNIYITIKFKFSAEIVLIDDCASCVDLNMHHVADEAGTFN